MSKNNTRRYNPLLDEWVIVASNRVNRPWQGATTKDGEKERVKPDKINPLAPGGIRSNGEKTPDYTATHVFNNDFPSFTDFAGENSEQKSEDSGLFQEEEIRGVCKVICYHPDSNLTMAKMSKEQVRDVVNMWKNQYLELEPKYSWVQIFENRGKAVGCSNPHPHGQLWASDFLPTIPAKKLATQTAYFEKKNSKMLVDYLTSEVEKNERIVARNTSWTVLVPFWAFWPFETILLPNRTVGRYVDLTEAELDDLAEILLVLQIKYDNVFETEFPFGMGWASSPTGKWAKQAEPVWQLHASFYPPLLRSATIPKYVAGYELFAEKQRDTSPEQAAKILRELSTEHYSRKK